MIRIRFIVRGVIKLWLLGRTLIGDRVLGVLYQELMALLNSEPSLPLYTGN